VEEMRAAKEKVVGDIETSKRKIEGDRAAAREAQDKLRDEKESLTEVTPKPQTLNPKP